MAEFVSSGVRESPQPSVPLVGCRRSPDPAPPKRYSPSVGRSLFKDLTDLGAGVKVISDHLSGFVPMRSSAFLRLVLLLRLQFLSIAADRPDTVLIKAMMGVPVDPVAIV